MPKNKFIENIVENFKNIKIAVIGDLMLDEYVIGKVERISPEAPVPVVKVLEEKSVLGGAANVVNNLAHLGAKIIWHIWEQKLFVVELLEMMQMEKN